MMMFPFPDPEYSETDMVVDFDVVKKVYGTSDAGNVVLETAVSARATGKPDIVS